MKLKIPPARNPAMLAAAGGSNSERNTPEMM